MASIGGVITQFKQEIPSEPRNLDSDGFALPTYKTKLLVLSAESKQACEQQASDLAHYLQQKAPTDGDPDAASLLLQNICYTLDQRRRALHPWVAAGVVPFTHGLDSVVALLLSNHSGNNNTAASMFAPSHFLKSERPAPRIGFVFPGGPDAACWHATSMASELVPSYPAFKAALKEGGEHLRALGAAGWELLEELRMTTSKSRDYYSATSRVGDDDSAVGKISLPLCVALQIALTRLLRVWGVVPAAVVGCGSGEIAAAWAAGTISYAEAMGLAYHRGGSEAAQSRGGEEEEQQEEAAAQRYRAALPVVLGGKGKKSDVEDPESKSDRLGGPEGKGPVFASLVTGGRVIDAAAELADPEYWVGELTKPVRFVDACAAALGRREAGAGASVDVVIEVGPQTALVDSVRAAVGNPALPYFACLERGVNARDGMQMLAAQLLRAGQTINMEAVNFPYGKWPHLQLLDDLSPRLWDS